MTNNYTNKPIDLKSLNNIIVEDQLLELSEDETSSIKGGLLAEGSPLPTPEQIERSRRIFEQASGIKLGLEDVLFF